MNCIRMKWESKVPRTGVRTRALSLALFHNGCTGAARETWFEIPPLPYFTDMNKAVFQGIALALSVFCCFPGETAAQTTSAQEDLLATIEGPLTREALNATRLTLEEAGIQFRYGGFNFRPDGALVGAEIVLKVDGVEFHEYIEFVSDTCVLQIHRTDGLVMEGC